MTTANSMTDRDYIEVALNQHKLLAGLLTTGILESTSENLRHELRTELDDCIKHQKELFDLMNQKGWYQPKAASASDIASAQTQYMR
ncbi:MAG: spore coat protein [Bacillota bacterium]